MRQQGSKRNCALLKEHRTAGFTKRTRSEAALCLLAAGICAALAAGITAAGAGTALAGTWRNDLYGDGRWTYIDTNSVKQDGWKWIDGNQDGVYECYYLKDRILIQDTEIDGFHVNADGQWTVDGAVQTRTLPSWVQGERAGDVSAVVSSHQKALEESASQYTESRLSYDYILPDGAAADRYVGFSVQTYGYSEGAAHGMATESYYTFTPEKGLLSIGHIGGDALQSDIAASVRRTLKAKADSGELFLFDAPEAVNIRFDQNWMLASDGLHMIFGQYEIAPYAYGIIDITVPYSDIAGALNTYGRQVVGLDH